MYENYQSQQHLHQSRSDIAQPGHQQQQHYVQQAYQQPPPLNQYSQHPHPHHHHHPQPPSVEAGTSFPSSSSTAYHGQYPNYVYPQLNPQNPNSSVPNALPLPPQPSNPSRQYYQYPIHYNPPNHPNQQFQQNANPSSYSNNAAHQYQGFHSSQTHATSFHDSNQKGKQTTPVILPTFGRNSFLHSGEFRFTLEVAQHPVRARMCGFGDKDRRQITPPPCVRLRIRNTRTNAEFTDMSSIDTSFYALLVELWSVDMTTNMSLVHPSGNIYHSSTIKKQPITAAAIGSSSSSGNGGQQTQPSSGHHYHQPHYSNIVSSGSSSSRQTSGSFGSGTTGNSSMPLPTRNLIGTLVATAHKLHDLNDEQGIWFILQDLSVRTEGEFRLKFSFVNLAEAVVLDDKFSSCNSLSSPYSPANSAPVLASVFSNPFYSYSAKKFPGVIDSTELSRCFANQGIKIPIRREQKPKERK